MPQKAPDAPTTIDSTPPPTGGRLGFVLKIASCLLAVAIALAVFYAVTRVEGLELNPTTLELRAFKYHKIPFTRFQISGIVYTGPDFHFAWTPNAVGDQSGLAPAITTHLRRRQPWPPRWDLVQIQSLRSFDTGPARILTEMLHATTPYHDPFWEKWSLDHPQLAALLWPAVQDLAGAGMYTELPDLCELVAVHAEAGEFEQSVRDLVFPLLRDYAWKLDDSGDHQMARIAATAALEYGSEPRLRAIAESPP